ncbi:MAG: hypothetical protein WDW36_008749 [Sanguina aurantia]
MGAAPAPAAAAAAAPAQAGVSPAAPSGKAAKTSLEATAGSAAARLDFARQQAVAPSLPLHSHATPATAAAGVPAADKAAAAAAVYPPKPSVKKQVAIDGSAGAAQESAADAVAATSAASSQPKQAGRKRKQMDEGRQKLTDFLHAIHMAAKMNDMQAAMSTFEEAVAAGAKLNLATCNSLLYLTSGGENWEWLARGAQGPQPTTTHIHSTRINLPPPAPAPAPSLPPAAPSLPPPPAASEEEAAASAAAAAAAAATPAGNAVPHVAVAAAAVAAVAPAVADPPAGPKDSKSIQQAKNKLQRDRRVHLSAAAGPAPAPSRAAIEKHSAAMQRYMEAEGIRGDHVTFTSLARVESILGRPKEALAWATKALALPLTFPQLRLFHPAMVGYALIGDVAAVFEIEALVTSHKLDLSEYEFARELEAIAVGGSYAQWKGVLSCMRLELNHLSPPTLAIIEGYYRSERALSAFLPGSEEAAFGSRWEVVNNCAVNRDSGFCETAGGTLQLVDLEEHEWAPPDDFAKYMEWHKANGPFDVLLDGANIAYFGQNRPGGGFWWPQIQSMMKLARARNPDAKILLMLHRKRLHDPEARTPEVKAFLAELNQSNEFYSTPPRSNDDWYWLYATVMARGSGLLISNDQLRDHIFSLLRPKHFLKWKARHIAGYTYSMSGRPELILPPSYTHCVQQMVGAGCVMVPAAAVVVGEEERSPAWWMCVKPVGEPVTAAGEAMST